MRDLVAGTPKAGEQTAAIQLTLSSRSRHVLRRIAVWPLMNRKELLALTGLARAHLVSVLGELERLKLVRVAEYEGVSRYSLTGVGLKFLADSRGYSPVRYARLRRWPLRPGSKTLSVVALERALVHTTVVREFLVELWQAASQGGRLVVWDEYDARQVVRFGGRQHLFAPDAAGVFRKGEQERAFFLEVDRGTVTPSRMRSKLQAFAAFQRSGVPGGGTALLVLCPDEARAQKILKLARGVGLGGGEKSPVLVTTYALREAHGLTGRIWRQATQPGLRRLF